MGYLHRLIFVAVLGLLAVSLDAGVPREANLATAYYSVSNSGGAGAGGPMYGGLGYTNVTIVGGGMQGASILQSGWNRSYVGVPPLRRQVPPVTIPSQPASIQQPVSGVIGDSSSGVHISASNPFASDSLNASPASSISEFLLQSLGGTASGGASPTSPFFTGAADSLTKLLELADFSDEVWAPAHTNPTTATPAAGAAPSVDARIIPPQVTAPSVMIAPVGRATNGKEVIFQGLTAPETTFADDVPLDDREYIHEIADRLHERRFVSQADYDIALTLAQHRVVEARAQLETRSSFQKFMDWLGVGSSLMIAYQQSEADLAALTYAAGLAGLGR